MNPFPYQERLATVGNTLPVLLNIPTGLGKTAAVVLAWIWRRRFAPEEVRKQTPRRLVYCLPMRVLVEQTYEESVRWLDRLGLLAGEATWENAGADGLPTRASHLTAYAPDATNSKECWSKDHGDDGTGRIAVHLLMGGEEQTDWALWPERDAILIGTQDMLISRSLNRGYGMSRYRWPVHFGLLNNDSQWVMDEVQLMGSGLLTTAQLAAFGEKLWQRVKPCRYMWMSATLGDKFLDTRDRRDWKISLGDKLELSDADRAIPEVQRRLRASKTVAMAKDRPKPSLVLDELAKHGAGRLTLLVLNTVPAAKKVFNDLKEAANEHGSSKKSSRKKQALSESSLPSPSFCLVHGRFRPVDRNRELHQVKDFVSRMDRETGAVPKSPGLVLVSTQVVEAGVDISSVRLWSEIAPWASVVQRLGRLNREGKQPNSLATFWLPKEEKDGENNPDWPNAKRIGPYDKADIDTAQQLLDAVQTAMKNGVEYRDALDEVNATEAARNALQVSADCVIRPNDTLELFGTDPDLAGGFTNVSQFVRDSDRNVDVQVFWRDFSAKRPGKLEEGPPHRDELCPVPFFELRRFLGKKGGAWEWSGETRRWERRSQRDVWPGMTLLLPLSAGGYSDELGWTGDSGDKPTADSPPAIENDALDNDPTSQAHLWYPLADHLADVEAETDELVAALQPEDAVSRALRIAARWHDWGKSLPRWQQAARKFADDVRMRIATVLDDTNAAVFHQRLKEWLPKWTPPPKANGTADLWAKFPDVRDIWNDNTLSKADVKKLRQLLRTQFTPRVRHEAASALAAWEAWLEGSSDLTALAVFLIASHHGKVRMALRSTQPNDEVFGLKAGDTLLPIPGFLPDAATLQFDAKHLGAHGTWTDDDSAFEMASPSWAEVVVELLGSAMPGACPASVIPDHEPRNLGPFALAYYEAILVAADIRASQRPGKAKEKQRCPAS